MSGFDDMDYYARRERAERALADRIADPISVGIHRELADLYQARIARPVLQVAGQDANAS